MKRRDVLKLVGGTVIAGAAGLPLVASAEAQKTMVVIHKIAAFPGLTSWPRA